MKFWIMTALALCVLSSTAANERGLLQYLGLERDGNYSEYKQARPRNNHSEVVDVLIAMEIQQIVEMDEKNQVLKLIAFVSAIWRDDFLVWNPDAWGGLNQIVVAASEVWLPDFVMGNHASTYPRSTYANDFCVLISSDGTVMWGFGGLMELLCKLNLQYYPFDSQQCAIELKNFMYTAAQVDLLNASSTIATSNIRDNGLWTLDRSEVIKKNLYYEINPGVAYPRINFVFDMSRKSAYYTINYIVPSLFMLFLALASFWLSPESGEKIGLSITVMLTFSVFQLGLTDLTPSSSDATPVLVVFFLMLMGTCTFSTITSIWVKYMFRIDSGPPPNWACKLYFEFLAKVVCMKSVVPEWNNENAVEDSSEKGNIIKVEEKIAEEHANWATKDMKDIGENVRSIAAHLRSKDETSAQHQWKAIARITDRWMFWIITCMCIIETLALVLDALAHKGYIANKII